MLTAESTPMRKFLISILVLMSLCSGSAFAWDKHPASMSNHGVAVAMDMTANHDHSDDFSQNGSYPDDHCSHGAAHLVGIFYDASLKALNIDHSYRAVAVVSFPSLYISPLLRPPIV
ncbi:MAG: hypothetical protein L3J98_16030 [Gammaproteobacteria bacterium]|nr:hypothetical protein [Gammaproteobacteria bacterium]MCF6261645.1 hypothetical protein [Gammaproteobacteria bacterium]